MFIVIEGIDACGKTTQVGLLLEQLGANYLKFPDPESPTGKLIYSHLEEKWHARPLDAEWEGKGPEINALMFQCLHFANRLERAEQICNLRAQGEDIVTDRYLASAVAYGAADGLDMNYLIETQAFLPQPDLNILLNIDLKESQERRPDRRDRYEKEAGFLERVVDSYRKLWSLMSEDKDDSYRWVVVDGNRSVVEVQADVITAVKAWQAYNQTGSGRWRSDVPNLSNSPKAG